MSSGLRLNLGCGSRLKDGFINVDRHGEPDVRHDLEVFPWPWADDSVELVLFIHSLEHLGQTTDVFKGIMQELHRVCCDRAQVVVIVPHHSHEYFYGDPTHVRALTREMFDLFSKTENLARIARHAGSSSLALEWDIDFEVRSAEFKPSQTWYELHPEQRLVLDAARLHRDSKIYGNLIEQVEIRIEAVKPAKR